MTSKPENSDEKPQGKAIPEDLDGENPEVEAAPSAVEPSIEDKLAQSEKDHLYLRAEFENFKRQSIKERSQLLKYGAERLARDLLETLDVFESALDGEVNADNLDNFVKGIELTSQQLRTTLEKHGIKKVDCVGQAFDPNTQEALSSEPSDQYPEGHVSQVFKAPYMYQDKLLRAGQVVVTRAKNE